MLRSVSQGSPHGTSHTQQHTRADTLAHNPTRPPLVSDVTVANRFLPGLLWNPEQDAGRWRRCSGPAPIWKHGTVSPPHTQVRSRKKRKSARSAREYANRQRRRDDAMCGPLEDDKRNRANVRCFAAAPNNDDDDEQGTR